MFLKEVARCGWYCWNQQHTAVPQDFIIYIWTYVTEAKLNYTELIQNNINCQKFILITYIQNIPTETSVRFEILTIVFIKIWAEYRDIFHCVNWYVLTSQMSLLLHIKGSQTRGKLRGLVWRWRQPDPKLHQGLFTNLYGITPQRNFNLKINVTILQYHIWLVTGYNFIISYHQCFILRCILFAKCQTDNANSILPLPEFLQCFHFLQF